ncbi:cdc42 small effector protein 2 [Limosa lapponica baueri]|uniref:Cdc42 small effector protein 2 n=1 Tax=Limosa lapponica baueri TaxID=1758121 RepID=A0A2I0TU09_LIMLA|nr:cdc42 small effector protein 2 [Limosa lapponica baueri]
MEQQALGDECQEMDASMRLEMNIVSVPAFQKRRRRIDRSMIGEPTNFVHTAHVGSGDLFSGMNSVSMSG